MSDDTTATPGSKMMAGPSETSAYEAAMAMSLPHFTINSVMNAMSMTEVSSVLMFNGKPTAMLTMAPSMAKTYGKMLVSLIEQYESDLDMKVLTVEEITEKLKAIGRIP